jgi:hypothetical protein
MLVGLAGFKVNDLPTYPVNISRYVKRSTRWYRTPFMRLRVPQEQTAEITNTQPPALAYRVRASLLCVEIGQICEPRNLTLVSAVHRLPFDLLLRLRSLFQTPDFGGRLVRDGPRGSASRTSAETASNLPAIALRLRSLTVPLQSHVTE